MATKDHPIQTVIPKPQEIAKIEVLSDLFSKDLAVKSKDIELRKEELALRKKTEQYNFEFSMATLEAKKEDRANHMKYMNASKRNFYIFMLIAIISIVFLIFHAITHDKDNIAKELIQALIYITIALGGYYVGKSKIKQDDKKEDKADS